MGDQLAVNPDTEITALGNQLDLIADLAKRLELEYADTLARVRPEFFDSARNLLTYIALRSADRRSLQKSLARLGLSSLGRSEKNVLAVIRTVQKVLQAISQSQTYELGEEYKSFESSEQSFEDNREALLGRPVNGRDVGIMVTMPAEAAEDNGLVQDMMLAGMDIARINCAHDDEDTWLRTVRNIDRASKEMARPCRVVMDLAGPKLRTGPLRPGPGVKCIRPKRDALGRVIAPRRVRFIAVDNRTPIPKDAVIPVPGECIAFAEVGDVVRLRDTRGKKRKLIVTEIDADGLRLDCFKTTYVATGTKFKLQRMESGEKIKFRVGGLPAREMPIILKIGDTLILHRDTKPGEPAIIDADGTTVAPAHISCIPAEVFGLAQAGDLIHLNDGKIEGVLESASDTELQVTITRAKRLGSRLRANRGINLPNSNLQLAGLTDTDRRNLGFITNYADAVSLSFVSGPEDIIALQRALEEFPRHELGIIIKVETVNGFMNLPRLLLAAMRHRPAGVMIARGDLAVECGWERLAEIQEEMLWMC
ncbi:MAG: pyruvate kinase, partial [Woeseiaceae bacterium]|nr:pyruvate kinase [Woeseiaceae bacterium]